jgi:hypothetical protein
MKDPVLLSVRKGKKAMLRLTTTNKKRNRASRWPPADPDEANTQQPQKKRSGGDVEGNDEWRDDDSVAGTTQPPKGPLSPMRPGRECR